MTIGLTHGGSNVYSSQEPSREVLVGTRDGVAILERAPGDGWRVAQQALPGKFISSIVVEPSKGMIFAGAFFDSVYASADGGRTWEERGQGITERDVYSLAWKRLDRGIRLYAGTQPAHLFQSDDLGLHWSELPSMRSVTTVGEWSFPAPPHIAHTKFITFDPHDPKTIYACIEQGALLKSTDLGATWEEVNTLGFYKDTSRPAEHFYDIHKAIVDPRDPMTIFVTGGAGLYVTTNGGETWERRMAPGWAPDVYPDGMVHNPRNPDLMFISAAEHNPSRWRDSGTPGYSGSRIYRSRDGAKSWEVLTGGLPDRMQQEVGGLCLEAWDGGCQVFAATTAGEVFWSEDAGDTWSCIASGLSAVSKKGHERLLSAEPLGAAR